MKFDSQKIEFHILQSFPVSCLNRDDVGSPKSCMIGGVTRARVSSQCWKRAVRLALHDLGIKTGIRTKRLETLLEKACVELSASPDAAKKAAETMAGVLSDDTLMFVSEHEVGKLAEAAKARDFNVDGKAFEKELKKLSKNVFDKSLDALDIALFGRMVAKAPVMNIEAASSFSHAISTHKVISDLDYFTAVDDYSDEEDDSYVYPRIAAKVIIADNKVAKAARAILKGDGEDDAEENVSEPSDNKKVEDGKKGENVEPSRDQNNEPEIDDNLIKYLALMLLILLLIVIISGGIIINSKRKNQQISE